MHYLSRGSRPFGGVIFELTNLLIIVWIPINGIAPVVQVMVLHDVQQ